MRRSKTEMYIDALRSLADGPKKVTKVMYAANINCGVVKRILDIAAQRGDIKKSGKKPRFDYAITAQGSAFAEGFQQYKGFSEKLEKEF